MANPYTQLTNAELILAAQDKLTAGLLVPIAETLLDRLRYLEEGSLTDAIVKAEAAVMELAKLKADYEID